MLNGAPLAPFIFILCSEVLSKLVVRAERNREITGVCVARNATHISHLFYADDSIFFCQATVVNVDNMMNCIQKYEGWSGQRVNKQKSGLIFSPNTSRRCHEDIEGRMGINCLNLKEKYLGNPFFFTANKKEDYQFLTEKILGRLEGWKARHLAQVGRSVLIGSVVQSVLNYFMSMVLVPQTLCSELDRILSKFWWLEEWGLTLGKFADMNMALLAKLFWMVLKDENKVWVCVLRDKYCQPMSPWTVEKKVSDLRCWKSILEARKIYIDGVGIIVADGDSELWDKPWILHRNMEELKANFKFRNNQGYRREGWGLLFIGVKDSWIFTFLMFRLFHMD
uniref:Reverse transcriptase domain-containing protein n=1 Tax=Cannabis sativa TaxID=3483 RepID=A0A803Q1F1_CANSA